MTDLLVEARVAPREKFRTIYSGLDTAPFLGADEQRAQARRDQGYLPEHVVVGKIARLFNLKGHQYVIEAARRVINERPHTRFLFVGDGILRAQYERQIADAGLADYFQFTGLVAPAQIPALLGAMDVLVHASLREGLARALPQALIAGKPVVSFDVDGAREVVVNGQTGFLIPPCDVSPLADALIELSGDAELRRRLGAEGRARFATQFCYREMTKRLHELYERLLGHSKLPH
jgi:glycosyltransferase involved in cell wall biosynthesis